MNENQLHHTDLSFFVRMDGQEAREYLDGKTVFFDQYGFDVTYAKAPHNKLRLTVTDHYQHVREAKYTICPNGGGKDIVDVTYHLLGSYIMHNQLNEPRAS